MTTRRNHLLSLIAICGLSVGCRSNSEQTAAKTDPVKGEEAATAAPQKVTLNGAGASFPYPLYSKWISEYSKVNATTQINYQSVGSGAGIRQVIAKTVDFGATDAPMAEEDAGEAKGKLVHLPTTLGAVVVAANVPGVTLKLDASLLAGLFLGTVKKWNDPKVQALNPDANLPDLAVMPVFRSDGSGTTAVFTDYLSKTNADWKAKVGEGKAVSWPAGLGAKGNEGVTGQVKATPGSIGYLELAYALQNKLSIAELKNKSGTFVTPSIESISAAAQGVELPGTLHASITDSADPNAYPIASYTYLLVYEDALDARKGKEIAKFAWWALNDGQKFAAALHYAPLPQNAQTKVHAQIKKLHHGGQPLL